MRPVRHLAILLAVAGILAGCAASGGGSSTPAATAPAATVPTAASTEAPTPTPVATPTVAPTPKRTVAPTQAGPVVMTSTLYPYRLTVPKGPTSFHAAVAPWDGRQAFSTDSRTTDGIRVPGATAISIAMIDTPKDFEAFAKDVEAVLRAGHGCAAGTGKTSFTAAGIEGIAFMQSCASGRMHFVRAIMAGNGHGLVAYSDGGTIDDLVRVLGGIEFVDR